MRLGTRFVHRSSPADEATGAIVPGIHTASTFVQEGLGKHKGFEYARTDNPTRHVFEAAVADFDGGARATAFASGMAATTTLTSLLSAGDHVVAGEVVYGGTRRVFDRVFARMGVEFVYVDTRDAGAIADAIRDETRLVFLESLTNPLMQLTDLADVAKRTHDVWVAVDNTFLSPYAVRPIDLGCDWVVHSATKYIGGHSDLVAGVVTARRAKDGEDLAFLQNAMGGVAAPFDCWLALRGLKTLHLRMQRHSENALAVAQALEVHPKVGRVHFPGLPSHPQHELAKKQMACWGGMLSFEIDGGRDAAERFLQSLRVFRLAESLGSVESLASHPATMTHAGLTEQERKRLGIVPGLVRLSVGVEEVADLVEDVEAALKKA